MVSRQINEILNTPETFGEWFNLITTAYDNRDGPEVHKYCINFGKQFVKTFINSGELSKIKLFPSIFNRTLFFLQTRINDLEIEVGVVSRGPEGPYLVFKLDYHDGKNLWKILTIYLNDSTVPMEQLVPEFKKKILEQLHSLNSRTVRSRADYTPEQHKMFMVLYQQVSKLFKPLL